MTATTHLGQKAIIASTQKMISYRKPSDPTRKAGIRTIIKVCKQIGVNHEEETSDSRIPYAKTKKRKNKLRG